MKVSYNENSGLYEGLGAEYSELVGSFGWMNRTQKTKDMQQHWFLAIGQTAEGEYEILVEVPERYPTSLLAVVTRAIELKDQLLLTRVFHDGSEPEIIKLIRSHPDYDGLFGYRDEGSTLSGCPRYVMPPKTWESFRSYETVAEPTVVPEQWRNDLQAAVECFVGLWNRGVVRPDEGCAHLQRVMRGQPADLPEHPLVRAAAWAVYLLEKEKGVENTVSGGGWSCY